MTDNKATDNKAETNKDLANKELAGARAKIDVIDQQLVDLISQRANIAAEVARIKKQANADEVDFYRPGREAEVLRRIEQYNNGPLEDRTLQVVLREVMSACLALEAPLQVAYLGPEGTYTQAAVYKHFGHAVQTLPLASIDAIFREVEAGNADYGVVPVENSTEGVVNSTLDQLVSSKLQICGEVALAVHHYLLSNAQSTATIRRVVAHAQSLAQCRTWLDTNLPGVVRESVASNGVAAQMAAEEGSQVAAIAGKAASEVYDLPVLAANIEDEPNNTTRFLILGTREVPSTGDDRTSIMVAINNKQGMLHKLLEPIANAGVDMVRIESRPSRRQAWDYNFFIDMTGHVSDTNVQQALEVIGQQAATLKILGAYPRAVL